LNYPTALEGALKLKELSYIQLLVMRRRIETRTIAVLDASVRLFALLFQALFMKNIVERSEARARAAK